MFNTDEEQQFAELMANNHAQQSYFYWQTRSELDYPELYTLQYYVTRDSGILEQSNALVSEKLMSTEFPDENNKYWWSESHSHWACGWTQCFVIKVYTDISKTTLTPEFVFYIENIYTALENYPILDEEHYSNMEYEAGWENFEQCFSFENDEDLQQAWEWLGDDGYESVDDMGGYPTEEQIAYIEGNYNANNQ